jgi:serine protease AprX
MKLTSLHLPFAEPNIRSSSLRFLSLLLTGLSIYLHIPAQHFIEKTAPSKYRVIFADKDFGYSLDDPSEFLSPAAIERRQKLGIPVTENDLPVSPFYISTLQSYGVKVINSSKWFNSVTVLVQDTSVLNDIASLPFVIKNIHAFEEGHAVNNKNSNTMSVDKFSEFDYGPSWLQTAVHNGHLLHQNGYTGNGITIAVLDAGFSNADTLPVFNRLFENGKILGTRDFVEPGNNVYKEATHGMSVLSIIGGYQTEGLIGTAPDASFWLLRTEDGSTEYIIEEDNWIAGAEFADSAGADIINTSLGYSVFNDSSQNHTYNDMDGNTTRVSRAADIAASKGMLVIVSAGNQGNVQWKYITAPADGDSVLTVGAIDRTSILASFSSRGPSSDGQIKPNIVAFGQGIYVAGADGSVRQGNGTSFSAPVITGLSACLWQANPDMNAQEIFSAIIESADRFYNPDNDYGYGLPDYNLANLLLKAKKQSPEKNAGISAFPNPFYNHLYVFFKEPVSTSINIRLFDLMGKEVFQNTYAEVPERKFLMLESDLERIQRGIYIIRIESGDLSGNFKLIKY